MMSFFFRLVGISLVCIVLATGCVATVRPAYAVATYEPRDLDRYPQATYDGQPVYYVDGYWYARQGPRWVYYREEPPELYQYRSHRRVRRAAPAYRDDRYERSGRREHSERRDAPPADERISAPPAERR